MRNRVLLILFVALGVRLALFVFAFWRLGGLTPVINLADEPSYAALAHMIGTGERPANRWMERMFPGWPLLLAIPCRFLPIDWTILLMGALLAAAVPVLFFLLTRDFGMSVAVALVPPTWLKHSCIGMSEPAMLVLVLLSLVLYVRGKKVASAIPMAASTLIRPVAGFAAIGVLWLVFRRSGWRRAMVWAAIFSSAILFQVAFNLHYYGVWNRQARLYANDPTLSPEILRAFPAGMTRRAYLNVPFASLILTPLRLSTPPWKVAFIAANVVAVVVSCVFLLRRLRDSDLSFVFAVWGILNAGFIFCLGPYWGFHSFDRYAIAALPAYAFAFMPRRNARPPKWRGAALVVACVSSILMAAWGLTK
ncbi:MAG: hypothetical protein ACRD16_00405 [Thermoanaerobaculia bacterium]